jgi:hypothetical protein
MAKQTEKVGEPSGQRLVSYNSSQQVKRVILKLLNLPAVSANDATIHRHVT